MIRLLKNTIAMKKIKTIFISSAILLFISFHGNAQKTVEGVVLDSISHSPIGYVNIGILENANGTVSNDNGQYRLKLKSADKTIQFSSIGFYSKKFKIKNWNHSDTVFLSPRTYGLSAIEVNANEFNEDKTLGTIVNKKNSKINWAKPESLGVEIGVRIKITKETLLKSAHFSVHQSVNRSILFRLNIYEFTKRKAGKNLLHENIFVQSKDLIDYGEIDLSHLNLVVDKDVLVTLETIEMNDVQKESYLSFSMQFKRKTNIYYRDAIQSKFKKGMNRGTVPFAQIGCYLKVKQ